MSERSQMLDLATTLRLQLAVEFDPVEMAQSGRN